MGENLFRDPHEPYVVLEKLEIKNELAGDTQDLVHQANNYMVSNLIQKKRNFVLLFPLTTFFSTRTGSGKLWVVRFKS